VRTKTDFHLKRQGQFREEFLVDLLIVMSGIVIKEAFNFLSNFNRQISINAEIFAVLEFDSKKQKKF